MSKVRTYLSGEQEKEEIPEQDKPFYLAIVSSVITGMCVWIGAVGAAFSNQEMVEFSKHALQITFPLTTMSWAFYFKGKK